MMKFYLLILLLVATTIQVNGKSVQRGIKNNVTKQNNGRANILEVLSAYFEDQIKNRKPSRQRSTQHHRVNFKQTWLPGLNQYLLKGKGMKGKSGKQKGGIGLWGKRTVSKDINDVVNYILSSK